MYHTHQQSDQPSQRSLQATTWWVHLWRGLVDEPTAKHTKAMGMSFWLYDYLLLHANRSTGTLSRRIRTIASDTGWSVRTIQSC